MVSIDQAGRGLGRLPSFALSLSFPAPAIDRAGMCRRLNSSAREKVGGRFRALALEVGCRMNDPPGSLTYEPDDVSILRLTGHWTEFDVAVPAGVP